MLEMGLELGLTSELRRRRGETQAADCGEAISFLVLAFECRRDEEGPALAVSGLDEGGGELARAFLAEELRSWRELEATAVATVDGCGVEIFALGRLWRARFGAGGCLASFFDFRFSS